MTGLCAVCQREVEPDEKGRVRYEQVRQADTQAGTDRIAWGPFPCHDDCAMNLRTIYDNLDNVKYEWFREVPQ